MAQVSAEQILLKIKQNGTYDAMRQEMLTSFMASERCQDFEGKVTEVLERVFQDDDTMSVAELTRYLERRVLSNLERHGVLEQLEKDARNFWVQRERRAEAKQNITRAIDDVKAAAERGSVTEAAALLDIDPPRAQSHGNGSDSRSHHHYRRGDAVAAFVSLDDVLCERKARYVCLAVEVMACDAERSMYTVWDSEALGDAQDTWVVYWDQIMSIKRPYECTYHEGDQVYALYRDDGATDTAVSTEFFPGRVERVGPMSLAIRYDGGGGLAHVYYDEVFAAGRVGFLRQLSRERRDCQAADAMTELGGRMVPSFTGFWPEEAAPELGKHSRRVRYRQLPPVLVSRAPPSEVGVQPDESQQRIENGERRNSIGSSRHCSDMDTGSSSASIPCTPEMPSAPPNGAALPPAAPVDTASSRQAAGSEEDGEIEAEEGECVDDAPPVGRERAVGSLDSQRPSGSSLSRTPHAVKSRWDQRSPVRRDDPYRRVEATEDSLSRYADRDRHSYHRQRSPEFRRPRRSRSRSRSGSRDRATFSNRRSPARHGYREDRYHSRR
ncbi:hypothetical protein H4R26_000397 [Coemansia thaxteri]|uniref:BOD1/SHG1 domain-containing protein n=1 Tax=Coemansia thaxteri TaxID=2663907 RepID=A0A9W8BMT3_9FUNG|nr:hypothetical protein H4R26_000397 [Coemansia thaxteri]KAJ2487717.1 hypothetical protein EV174_000388 [Coemansia sp. RSA 2320]